MSNIKRTGENKRVSGILLSHKGGWVVEMDGEIVLRNRDDVQGVKAVVTLPAAKEGQG